MRVCQRSKCICVYLLTYRYRDIMHADTPEPAVVNGTAQTDAGDALDSTQPANNRSPAVSGSAPSPVTTLEKNLQVYFVSKDGQLKVSIKARNHPYNQYNYYHKHRYHRYHHQQLNHCCHTCTFGSISHGYRSLAIDQTYICSMSCLFTNSNIYLIWFARMSDI